MLTLDVAFGHLSHVDIIKMDIEGSEYRACMGGQRFFDAHRPIVCMEYCPLLLKVVSGVEPRQLIEFFVDRNYSIVVHMPDHAKKEMIGTPQQIFEAVNGLFTSSMTHVDFMLTQQG